jgi:hypothetical protein
MRAFVRLLFLMNVTEQDARDLAAFLYAGK